MDKNSKAVKLHGRSRPCQGSVTGNKEVPWLNVSGVWLEELATRYASLPGINC